ncbi:LysM peptidoglycan-binding domain-containing protein [Paenibacillus xerothermodurans]|uniref:LysM peptidoglycan-binding domain-containing protein n=1 Tax=Paenibacillus xerothermodurans TaxID=1977292 RepID=A0A2W1NBM8_PAEXE|nr:LysM peptidoglycan-binding domain-containing protein [Paenibacillus xerothermodurans]PZE21837.1 LysM peptidoglycan-binding domain-containing protein [Paenibacillus xerothermodurans]
MFMNEQLLHKSTPSAKAMGAMRRRLSAPSIGTSGHSGTNHSLMRVFGLLGAFVIIVILTVCLAFVGVEQDVHAAADESEMSRTVEVVPGDTLWDIANENVEQGQNVRDYMNEIRTLNDLASSTLQIGQILRLP